MNGQFHEGPPNLPPGIWVVACGVWMFVPGKATHTDIEYARRMLHRIELERLVEHVSSGVDGGGT